jgi:ATP-binding cassette subfamily B protein
MKNKKIKFQYQLNANDCGIACIQMICQYYGLNYDLKTIKEHCDISKLGASLKDIRAFFELIGFETLSVNIQLDDIEDIPIPAILYFKHGHYVILEKISISSKNENYYHIIDPTFGRIKLKKEELKEKWSSHNSGIALIINANSNLNKQPIPQSEKENKTILNNIKLILKQKKNRLFFVFLLTILVLVTNWGMPLLLKENIDKGILDKNINLVWTILIGQFIFILSNLISNSFSDIITKKISLDINIDLNKTYFGKILNLPMSYFERKFKSDLIEGLNDQNRINLFISKNVIGIVITLLNLIVFSSILIIYNYKIFAIFLLFSIIAIFVTTLFLKKKKFIDYSLFTLESQNRNNIYELIMGITEIKVNSAEDNRLSRWKNSEEKLKKIKVKSSLIDFYMVNSNHFISRFRDIFLIGMCSFLIIDNKMTLGTMMMISYVLGQLSAPVDDLIDFSQTLQKLQLSFDRLSDVYNKNEEIDENKKYESDLNNIKNITLNDVCFKYNSNDEDYVLKNISLSIQKNSTTAIVGSSGSGKSTLMKLLLGFYFPTKGVLKIENTLIENINLKEWRKTCGIIMQDGYIFSGTVVENISLSDLNPDMNKLEYSVKIAELESTIIKLPMKYNTQIGESGISLSGGEKQRLYIARAIYKNPDFIFFDEATSNLDTINENKIMSNLNEYLANKTAIIIAHRLSTVRNADNIIVLKNGEIVEQGKHSELLTLKGEYYNLAKNQLE